MSTGSTSSVRVAIRPTSSSSGSTIGCAPPRGERSHPGQNPRDKEVRGRAATRDIQARIGQARRFRRLLSPPEWKCRRSSASLTRSCWSGARRRAGDRRASGAGRRARRGRRCWRPSTPRSPTADWAARTPPGMPGAPRTAAGPSGWGGRPGFRRTSRISGSPPGAHGGTVTAIDEAASELIDPEFERPLRPVAPVAQLEFEVLPHRGCGWNTRRRHRKFRPSHNPTRPRRQPSGPVASRPFPPGRTFCSGSHQRRALIQRIASASIAIQPTATPAAAPRTNHRRTGCLRQSHSVGANPPTAMTFSPTDTSG